MFLSPEKIVEYCDVHHGMKVADFGSSIGQYAIPLAKRVGKHGTVYAVDVQKELLSKLRKEALFQKVENIKVVWGDIEGIKGTKLKDESVDRIFIINTFFQIENVSEVVVEARRILKRGGKVIFIEWADSFNGLGPHTKDIVEPHFVVSLFEENHFKKERDIPAGDHHYGIIFVK